MGAYRIMGHELIRDLFREPRIEATRDIDRGEFSLLTRFV
jgi:hypothetical protein